MARRRASKFAKGVAHGDLFIWYIESTKKHSDGSYTKELSAAWLPRNLPSYKSQEGVWHISGYPSPHAVTLTMTSSSRKKTFYPNHVQISSSMDRGGVNRYIPDRRTALKMYASLKKRVLGAKSARAMMSIFR